MNGLPRCEYSDYTSHASCPHRKTLETFRLAARLLSCRDPFSHANAVLGTLEDSFSSPQLSHRAQGTDCTSVYPQGSPVLLAFLTILSSGQLVLLLDGAVAAPVKEWNSPTSGA